MQDRKKTCPFISQQVRLITERSVARRVLDTYDQCMLTTPSQFGLVAINGAGAGSYFPLDPDSGVVTIGRDESRDLPIDDPLASRLHARLTWHGPNWHIED